MTDCPFYFIMVVKQNSLNDVSNFLSRERRECQTCAECGNNFLEATVMVFVCTVQRQDTGVTSDGPLTLHRLEAMQTCGLTALLRSKRKLPLAGAMKPPRSCVLPTNNEPLRRLKLAASDGN
jgi:hypothetical protein